MSNLNHLLWLSSDKSFLGGNSLIKIFLRKFEQ